MKKFLSVFLAILMVFSCFGAVCVSAADGEYTDEELTEVDDAMKYFKVSNLPESFDKTVQELIAIDAGKSAEDRINLLGMDLEYLYTNTAAMMWGYLDVYQKDAAGNLVYDATGNPIMKITKGEVAIMLSSISAYLKDLYYSTYGGLKLYTVNNAVSLSNIIGKMFFREFTPLTAADFNAVFGNRIPSAQEFFEAVVDLSGLDLLIQQNWCPRGSTFCQPIVDLLTGGYTDIYLDNYTDGKVLGARILEGMFTKLNIEGPVSFLIDFVLAYTRSYETVFREPTLALFTHKIEKILNFEYVSEYQTFSGLLKLMLCDCDPVAGEGCFSGGTQTADHFCPLEFPTMRIATAGDDDEVMIYLFYYFNLCGAYRNNTAFINNIKSKLDASAVLTAEDKEKVKSIFDGCFLNNIDSTTKTLIEPFIENILQPSTDGIFDRLKNSLQVFLKKIADYFDYLYKIFTGQLDYGEGGSPFI